MNIRVEIDKEEASEMWSDGRSITEIAARYGVTRSKMAGVMNMDRDLFPKRRSDDSTAAKVMRARKSRAKVPTEAPKIAANTRKARMEATRREAEEFLAGTSEHLKIVPIDAERLSTGKDLMDLGRHDCRFALNNGGPFIFCAAATGGEVYCSHHADRAYRVREAWMR